MGCAADAEAFAPAGLSALDSGFLGLSAFFRYWNRNFSETRLTSGLPLLLCRPRETGWRLKRERLERVSKFPLAAIEMIATVAGPSSTGSFENVAQFLQKSR
jgi:hypothetical protein